MISIRTFRNSDTPEIVRLWNAQHQQSGHTARLSTSTIEIVLLSRPFFEYQHLLVAGPPQSPSGFIHWVPLPAEQPSHSSPGTAVELNSASRPTTAVIANLVVPEQPDAAKIASELISAASHHARQAGFEILKLGQAPEHWTGYAGIASFGLGRGISDEDHRGRAWADSHGFTPYRWLNTYQVQLATYRPPFDRELLGLRRSALLERRAAVTDQPFRIATALSHLEVHRFIAHQRSGDRLARVDFLLSDPDMSILTGDTALITDWQIFDTPSPTLPPAAPPPHLPPRPPARSPIAASPVGSTQTAPNASLRFALVGAISELVVDRIGRVETTIESDDAVGQSLLESVGFTLHQRGTVYSKSLI